MNILDAFPASWRVDVTVTGPVHRDIDGYATAPGPPVTVAGCLIAPGASAAPGMTATDTSEATEDVATVYAPVGAPIRFRDTVTVPAGHPMAGDWLVDSRPAHWPLGVVATMTRR